MTEAASILLGVNVDHVATIRQARGTRYPDPVYAALMATIATIVGLSLANRVPLELDVLRDRNAPFREARGGLIENVYRLKILNMDQRAHAYVLSASGPAGTSWPPASGGATRSTCARVMPNARPDSDGGGATDAPKNAASSSW